MQELDTSFKCSNDYFNGNVTDLHLEQKLKESKKFHPLVPNPIFTTLTEETININKITQGYLTQVS